MTQAFLVNISTGETLQRMSAPSFEDYVTEAGCAVIQLGEGAGDIDGLETYLDGDLKVRPREFDPELVLAVAKVQAREVANRRRQEAEFTGVQTAHGPIDTDPDSQRKINGAATIALISKVMGTRFDLEWTFADNSRSKLTADQMIEIALAVGSHVSSCHECALAIKDQLAAATNTLEIEAIEAQGFWPDTQLTVAASDMLTL